MAAVSWPEMTSLFTVSTTSLFTLACHAAPAHSLSTPASSRAQLKRVMRICPQAERFALLSFALPSPASPTHELLLLRFDFLRFSLRCCFLASSFFFGIISFPLPGAVEIRVLAGRQRQRSKTSRRTSFCLHKISQVETSAQRSWQSWWD